MAEDIARPGISPKKDIGVLATGASISLGGRAGGQLLHIVSLIVLARLLGPEVFGLYALGWTILRMVGVVGTLGLEKGIIRFASPFYRNDAARLNRVLFQSLGIALTSGLLMGCVMILAAPWLAERVFSKPELTAVLRLFALGFPLIVVLKVAAAATQVSQRMEFAVSTEFVVQPTMNLILVLLFYLLGWKLLGSVAATVLSFALACVLALYYVRRLFPGAISSELASIAPAKGLLTFSLSAALAGMAVSFTIWIDRLFIGYYRPAAEVGVYQALSQSSLLFAIILGAINAVFSPLIADLYHKGQTGQLQELYRVSTKWGLYIGIPAFLIICFVPTEMLTVVFGSEYANGALPLLILTTAQLINIATGAVGFLLIMTGHQNHWLMISGFTLAIGIGLNLLLIPRLGLTGAALATAVSTGGLFLLGLFHVRRTLGLWPYDRRYLKGLLATLAAAAALYLLRHVAVDSPTLALLLTGIVSVGVFGGTLLLLGLDDEDREFVQLIKSRPQLRRRTDWNASGD